MWKTLYFKSSVFTSINSVRKPENPNKHPEKHHDSILNHHVIFLDYDFRSSLLNSCSSLIGRLWVIHMAANLCTHLCEIFQAAHGKADGAFPWEPQEALCAFSSGSDDITPHKSITSPSQHRNESPGWLAANLLVEKNVGYGDEFPHSTDLSLWAAICSDSLLCISN